LAPIRGPLTWLADPDNAARAALRLVSSTTQTLPSGPVALFAGGGFAGEVAIGRLKPKERRFLRFGADLDVELKVERSDRKDVIKRVTFANGALAVHSLRTTTSEWAVQNRSGQARKVYVGLAIVQNATITGADALDFDTESNVPIAVMNVAARGEVSRAVTTVEGLSSNTGLGQLRSETLTAVLAAPDLAPPEKATLGELEKAQLALEELQRSIDKAKADLAAVTKDTDRLREYLKAAGGEKGAAGAQGGASPFVMRILAAEDRLTALRKQLEKSEAERVVRATAVRTIAERLPSR